MRSGLRVASLWNEAVILPGNRITDRQMNKYRQFRADHTQETAASKAGISVSSARRVESSTTLPSQRPARHWRTRMRLAAVRARKASGQALTLTAAHER